LAMATPLGYLTTMLRIRRFEEAVLRLAEDPARPIRGHVQHARLATAGGTCRREAPIMRGVAAERSAYARSAGAATGGGGAQRTHIRTVFLLNPPKRRGFTGIGAVAAQWETLPHPLEQTMAP